ncbi:MAG: hypothetical protein OYK82_07930 [Gammaproteobacteria bacterium]|nr:hypothetical protein [Gammaproteobacteria bacterium]
MGTLEQQMQHVFAGLVGHRLMYRDLITESTGRGCVDAQEIRSWLVKP